MDNRRNDLQSRYSLLINEFTIRTQQRDANPLFNDQQRRQVDRLRNELLQTQNQNHQLRNKNRDMINSIDNLKQKIRDLKDDGK
jgi:cytochrome c-type biogenesis protein CcmH/NrfF